MKKTIGKLILAAIAVGLVSISYVFADTVNQAGKNLLVMLWPEEYIPREYHDVQWTDSTPIGDVHYTGDVDKGLVRSVTWYKDNMAYFLFFQVPVKASEIEFYRDHIVSLKDIDFSRTDLIGVKTIR